MALRIGGGHAGQTHLGSPSDHGVDHRQQPGGSCSSELESRQWPARRHSGGVLAHRASAHSRNPAARLVHGAAATGGARITASGSALAGFAEGLSASPSVRAPALRRCPHDLEGMQRNAFQPESLENGVAGLPGRRRRGRSGMLGLFRGHPRVPGGSGLRLWVNGNPSRPRRPECRCEGSDVMSLRAHGTAAGSWGRDRNHDGTREGCLDQPDGDAAGGPRNPHREDPGSLVASSRHSGRLAFRLAHRLDLRRGAPPGVSPGDRGDLDRPHVHRGSGHVSLVAIEEFGPGHRGEHRDSRVPERRLSVLLHAGHERAREYPLYRGSHSDDRDCRTVFFQRPRVVLARSAPRLSPPAGQLLS